MGSEGLSNPNDEVRSWLRNLDCVADTDDALRRLGAIAAAIADALDAPAPAALPTAPPASIPASFAVPELLGMAWEAMMAPEDRRQQGSHFTPPEAAAAIVALARERLDVDGVPVVWDPTCGGGAFLLAAARALHGEGHERGAIVSACHGTDIDPVALRVTDAALELWASGAGRPHTAQVDLLADPPSSPAPGTAQLVVGNPPFLGQLTADTARTDERRRLLVDRFGDAAKGYVDDVGLITLAAVHHAAEGAVVALVAPESFLGARDAGSVRSELTAHAALQAVWVESDATFEANVDVVAPVLVVGGGGARTEVRGATTLDLPRPTDENWAPVLAAAAGVPMVEVKADRCVGDIAEVTAGFRQHFYGLHGAVREAGVDDDGLRLVTSGAIDPLQNLWGQRAIRFGGQAWDRPVVDIDRIEDRGVAEWFLARSRPKVLVASQTRVIESLVDERGTMLPSVPVISVEPSDASDLWHLAAVLSSPVASAIIAAASAGTGLSRAALRVRASELGRLPLPAPSAAWDAAARAVERAQSAADAGDGSRHRLEVRNAGREMAVAYGIDRAEPLVDWWCDRIRFPDETRSGVE